MDKQTPKDLALPTGNEETLSPPSYNWNNQTRFPTTPELFAGTWRTPNGTDTRLSPNSPGTLEDSDSDD